MVEVLVLYYSRTGRTETLANFIAEGARTIENVSVSVKRVDYAEARAKSTAKNNKTPENIYSTNVLSIISDISHNRCLKYLVYTYKSLNSKAFCLNSDSTMTPRFRIKSPQHFARFYLD